MSDRNRDIIEIADITCFFQISQPHSDHNRYFHRNRTAKLAVILRYNRDRTQQKYSIAYGWFRPTIKCLKEVYSESLTIPHSDHAAHLDETTTQAVPN